MAETSLEKNILDEVHKLATPQKERVLEFARSLVNDQAPGISGECLLRFAGAIDKANLEEIAQAIERGCERVDYNEW